MKNYLYIIVLFLLIPNCTLNKVEKYQGVHFLEKKQKKLIINSSNSNDIIQLLGPASTKSTFNSNMWIYIERVTSSSKLSKLGKKKLIKNNVLIIEINNEGLLLKKIFLNKDNMNDIEFTEDFIKMTPREKSFIYNFLSTLRKKMNDPLGKKIK
jgi:outer membrane protein assembly factor BamE (lipoprotein component of BamABCDE complex)